MAKKTQKQKLAAARRDARELRSEHQTGLRRTIGMVIRDGTAYGGPTLVVELQKAGMFPGGGMPWDVAVSGVAEFLGAVRWLGGASDVVVETFGGHTAGRLGGMATLRSLGIRYVNGAFVGANGEPLPTGS